MTNAARPRLPRGADGKSGSKPVGIDMDIVPSHAPAVKDAWVVTVVDAGKPGSSPFARRIAAWLKSSLRYWGLKCVADLPLRRLVVEECCRVLCPDCACGKKVKRDETGQWWHPQ